MVTAVLSQGFGYGIILGLGAAFGKYLILYGQCNLTNCVYQHLG
jgi:hypothetical protein